MERRGPGLAALGALGRRLLWALPAYAAGLLGLGAGALVLALALYAGWRRRRRARERSLRLAARLQRDEEAAVRAAAAGLGAARGELPAWVSFPDVERAEWLNKVLAQAWPFFGRYMEKLLVENVAPSIRASNSHLQTFTFTRVDMGEKLHGMLRIILEPLLGDVPIVGALTMFFIRRPTLDINWTGMTNLLDIPGLSSMSDTMIMDAISSYLVLPNRLLVPLVPDLHEAAQLRCPLPRVRGGGAGASPGRPGDLRSKDRFMGGLVGGKSDPYAVLRVGTQVVTSRVIDNELNPTWDEVYEFIVHEVPGQEIEVELFDKDPDQDDLLGRMKLDFGEVLKARVLEEWFPLQEGGRGRLHLRLEWLSLMADTSRLDQVLERNRTIVAKPDPPSAAILVVYLDRAEELPMKKPGKEPNPMVQVVGAGRHAGEQGRLQHVCSCLGRRFPLLPARPQEPGRGHPGETPAPAPGLPLAAPRPPARRPGADPGPALPAPALGARQPPLPEAGPAGERGGWGGSGGGGCPCHPPPADPQTHRCSSSMPLRMAAPHPLPPGSRSPWPAPVAPTGPPHSSPTPSSAPSTCCGSTCWRPRAWWPRTTSSGGGAGPLGTPTPGVRVAGRSFRSRVVKEELNPRWNEVYEAIVNNVPGQDVEFELFDKDLDKDDFLGRCKVPLRRVLSSRIVDEWLPLEDVKSGRLHVRLETLTPTPQHRPPRAGPAHQQPPAAPPPGARSSRPLCSPSSWTELPTCRSGRAPSPPPPSPAWPCATSPSGPSPAPPPPSPCGTKASPSSSSGRTWESLELQVKDEGGQPLGALSLPLPRLLACEGLALDSWLPLAGGGPGSQILLRAQLGVLVSQQAEEGGWWRGPGGGGTRCPPTRGGAGGGGVWGRGGCASACPRLTAPRSRRRVPWGRLQLTLWYHGAERKLVAIVHGCRKLKPVSKELPDPYVSLVLLPRPQPQHQEENERAEENPEPRLQREVRVGRVPGGGLAAQAGSSRQIHRVLHVAGEGGAGEDPSGPGAGWICPRGGPHWYELRDERSSP
ncbi:unnamed protein product [Bubo scandiacus]